MAKPRSGDRLSSSAKAAKRKPTAAKPKSDGSILSTPASAKDEKRKPQTQRAKPKSDGSVQSASSSANKGEKRKLLSRNQANKLLKASDEAVKSALKELEVARELAERAGLTVDAPIVEPPAAIVADETNNVLPVILRTTGGHSNTDHVVKITGDARIDRIEELKRNLIRRTKKLLPENKGEKAWDKPRVPGERRRRIIREKDAPEAPPEPPRSGYVIFIGQMTTKIRHDRPNERHQQTKVVQEISRIWRLMPESEREYYNVFSQEAYLEYQKQHMEYRATGHYTPSQVFQRIEGAGLWLRTSWQEKNGLEREISGYEKLTFPPRPPEYDEEYNRRQQASIRRRKLKLKGLLDKDGNEIVETDTQAQLPSELGDGDFDPDDGNDTFEPETHDTEDPRAGLGDGEYYDDEDLNSESNCITNSAMI